MSADPYDVAAAITKLREAAEALREDAARRLMVEPEVSHRLRTGVASVQESSESWLADEWAHWKLAGRSKKEFAEAYGPDEEEPELLPVTRKLLKGV